MGDDTTNWTELREFKGVALTDSFALSWHGEGEDLVVDLDLCLLPEHPFYEAPRRAESACIRPALLEFPGCSELRAGEATGRWQDVAARIGHGRIGSLRRTGDGRYEMSGDFGAVAVSADRPLLRFARLP